MNPESPNDATWREAVRSFLAGTGEIRSMLGFGTDGIVYSIDRPSGIPTVVKAFYAEHTYRQELASYQRLAEHSVKAIHGHQVPVLLDSDDALRLIEMSFVTRPYVLDFAKTYVDRGPAFHWEDKEAPYRERLREQLEAFDETQRDRVCDIYYFLRDIGIWYHDVRPQNIAFPDDS